MKIYCNTNKFPELSFSCQHPKPHGARGLSKHYHLRFYPKLGMGICAVRCIPFYCVACTSILDKLWISGTPSEKQERYKPVTKCTYWTLLGSFNNWIMIQLSQKSNSSDTFDEIHQFFIDGMSGNMSSLVKSVKYGAINITETSTNRFYFIMFI